MGRHGVVGKDFFAEFSCFSPNNVLVFLVENWVETIMPRSLKGAEGFQGLSDFTISEGRSPGIYH